MKPSALPLRARPRSICQLCHHMLPQPAPRRSFLTASTTTTAAATTTTCKATPALRLRRQPAQRHAPLPRIPTPPMATATAVEPKEQELGTDSPQLLSERIDALKARLAEVEKHIECLFSSNKIEPELAVLEPLATLEYIANQAIAIRTRQPLPAKFPIRQSSASAILSLNGDADPPPSPVTRTPKTRKASIDDLPTPSYLSRIAENLLKHKNVFISPAVLSRYVDLQRLLARPRAIPEIFYLYANKPVPQLGSSPPKFLNPSPKAAKQAIPAEIAEKALQAAIATKDMPLALDIIQTTYRAPAWQRHIIIKKVVPPGIVVTVLPLAIYMIAAELSVYSNYIDPWTFKWYAFAGMATYVLGTGTLGFVAMTTHNDNFERVVWRPGVPLTDRWLREDERAALDKIACAWGFKEHWRRGDEEGEEWEGLREWVQLRGMILDKPDLMEGMNA
ncbi:hypothetical protein K505DRAFT_328545 [Melanomma pulvis-pyrius CBS 109.77]|uniref:Uncharacterized protein n=1 Tax=Melanomma pulvis-pyrius CBS 109.77 TaxID=1314802 RepID=A0A6A6WY22_9PLEO|nr:hypothetical protein K505DRAFT_328545 [Melanomma pulvis-pyrius CBS 109.77]